MSTSPKLQEQTYSGHWSGGSLRILEPHLSPLFFESLLFLFGATVGHRFQLQMPCFSLHLKSFPKPLQSIFPTTVISSVWIYRCFSRSAVWCSTSQISARLVSSACNTFYFMMTAINKISNSLSWNWNKSVPAISLHSTEGPLHSNS